MGKLSPHSWSVTFENTNHLKIENTNQIAHRSNDSVGSKAALLNGILQTENRVCRIDNVV